MTKPLDFRQNYRCDFHLRLESCWSLLPWFKLLVHFTYRRCEELHVPAGPEGDVPAGTAAPLPGSTGSPSLCSQVGPLVYYRYLVIVLRILDPVPLLPGWVKISNRIRIRDEQHADHIFKSLKTIFWVKILKFFDADPHPRSGIFSILDPGPVINILDQQHFLVYS